MSDFGIYVTEEFLDDDKIKNTEERVSKEKDANSTKIKVIKILFWVLLAFIICEFVGVKVIAPLFKSPKVTISGNSVYSAEEIAKMILPLDSTNLFSFDCDAAASLISAQDGIETVQVYKKIPDKIFIEVTEREPVALMFLEQDGVTSAVQIDKSGKLFLEHGGMKVDKSRLPIISGLPVEYMAGGMRIPSKYRSLLERIYKLQQDELQNFFTGISEICVVSNDTGNYELEIIPAHSKIKVLADRSLNEEAIRYMMLLIDIVDQLNTDATEIDLRYGSVSYRTVGGDL